MISYLKQTTKKRMSPDDFKFTTIVIIAGFLYTIPITVAYLENNGFMNLFNSYRHVHLYHYAPEIFIPVTVTVLSIEWKKKVAPVVMAH
ncbi:hypothetical protein B9Z55_017257 [Caenorhabditis nigoni]|uniref:Uncharacterized protein n=1 Tax=Caenorhabditis nigoni TaxID=1611254 RepID=A0A2G5T920_9PELO|nr:hypothetical protein B9Z55_017257 [Caenorhabditis nigoni]